MIYRLDFSFRHLGVNINSPVIFGNIARILFEIMPDKAEKTVGELASNLLISDVFVQEELNAFLRKGRKGLEPFAAEAGNLRDKRKEYREWKNRDYLPKESGKKKEDRVRIRIDRKTGMAEEGMLFYDESWWGKGWFSVYLYLEDEKWLSLLELVFRIIEKTGLGTGISYGKGEVRFKREKEKIFIPDEDMYERFVYYEGDLAFNLASTIIGLDPFADYKFYYYRTVRYDGRSFQVVRPPYFLARQGIIKGDREGKAGIFIYEKGDMPVYIYNCVFPVRMD